MLARADEAATRAISTAPNDAHAHYVKAEALGSSNRFDAALATYDRAIALDRNHAAAYVGRTAGASDNPTFSKEFQRIVEGARKAGLPER